MKPVLRIDLKFGLQTVPVGCQYVELDVCSISFVFDFRSLDTLIEPSCFCAKTGVSKDLKAWETKTSRWLWLVKLTVLEGGKPDTKTAIALPEPHLA